VSNPQWETRTTRTTVDAARVASTVMHVPDVDRSVQFYRDVFCCHVALREPGAALLLTPDGFQIYLYSKGPSRRHGVGHYGVQYLMWATDSEAELQRITQRLRAHDSATFSHVENGVTFVEGCEPDRGRVIVAYPGPSQFPRQLIAARFRGN
jgi:catechol 2,3-dioxygenase-like lactoylglutathione lyase family enzyme